MSITPAAMQRYNDAELTAIQMVREAVKEQAEPGRYPFAKAINTLLLQAQKRDPAAGVTAVAAALARLSYVNLTVARKTCATADLLAFLDEFELHKMAQHQEEADYPEDYPEIYGESPEASA